MAKIMIVEDSKAMRIIIMRTLRQAGFGAHAVVEASNGQEALAQIQKGAPDLILCDWNMPEMNGIQLLEELQKMGTRSKFGFVTTESTPEMRKRAIDTGALFVITKPFTVESFAQTLGPVLN